MPAIELKVEQLVLDSDNPRITRAEGQQQALQKVVKDQKAKLVRLAESIVEFGLSPIEKFMVMEVSAKPKRYIALEGNRRVAALRILTNPAVMTGLDMPSGTQRSLEKLATIFDRSKVEPIEAYEVESRDEGRYWIELRHNGESSGRGVVGWNPLVASRYRERTPEIQAFDMVMEHGGFSEEEAEAIRSGFKLSTLQRLMDSTDARTALGLSLKGKQLHSTLPGSELIKALRKIVLDIANKQIDSRRLNRKERIVDYLGGFSNADRPDLSKKVAERPIEGIQKSEFSKAARTSTGRRRTSKPQERAQVVPKNCPINVTDNRISEIFGELQTLKLKDGRNAIAVLLRVFLELSVDHFLETNGGSLRHKLPGGREVWKGLDKKLVEVVEMLVTMGVPKAHFTSVVRDLSQLRSPMNLDLFHRYVHDRFATPATSDLTAAWDHAQPLFEKIWP